MKIMQKFVDYFWVDIDAKDLIWYDYVKMFGIPVGASLWVAFLAYHITW